MSAERVSMGSEIFMAFRGKIVKMPAVSPSLQPGKLAGFACRRCGACCRIPDGIVRVSDEEISRIARFLGTSEEKFIATQTALAPDRKGLVLLSRPGGACAFLLPDNRCRIHPVKPDKCRTFPFDWTNSDSSSVCPALAACTAPP